MTVSGGGIGCDWAPDQQLRLKQVSLGYMIVHIDITIRRTGVGLRTSREGIGERRLPSHLQKSLNQQ